jgi:hypothetical protein
MAMIPPGKLARLFELARRFDLQIVRLYDVELGATTNFRLLPYRVAVETKWQRGDVSVPPANSWKLLI